MVSPPSSQQIARAGLSAGHVIASRYRIEELLGSGGFGHVYRATQLDLDRPVALKVLAGAALASNEQLARFRREAVLAQRLEHPNTVRLLDHGVCEVVGPYIVMEHLRGESLAALIGREGAQPDERTGRVARQILKALMEAHELGVVHRDIKPANIFITAHAGEPFFAMLLDFGIAKNLAEPAGPASARASATSLEARARSAMSALTGGTHVMGTPRYMAPEQASGASLGPETDLYALGLTLAEMVCGRPVFDSDDALGIMMAHLSDEPVPLPPAIAGSRLSAIIQRATAKRRADRYRSAYDMLVEIEALQLPWSAALGRQLRGSGGSASAIAFAPTVETPLESRRSPARARPLPYYLAAGAAVAAALGAGVLVWHTRSGSPGAVATTTATAATPPQHPGVQVIGDPSVIEIRGSGPGFETAVMAFAPGEFEKDPRRDRDFVGLELGALKRTFIDDGWTVVSATIDEAGPRTHARMMASRGRCLVRLNYDDVADPDEAKRLAQTTGDSARWTIAVVSHDTRVLMVTTTATTAEDARVCADGVLAKLLRPASN